MSAASPAPSPRPAAGRSASASGAPRGTVSVIIPCYNYGRYLPGAVESVLTQTGVDVEVLVIDDASTDGSAAIAAGLAGDPRVEIRCHTRNRGHIATYNEGLEWARGTYTALMSADDGLTPGALRRARDLLDAHPRVGFVYGRPLVIRAEQPLPRARDRKARWRIWAGHDWLALRCRTLENCIKSPEAVARTSLLKALGGYRPELPDLADFELWMRLAAHADVGYVVGPHQAYYRDHASGMHRRPGRRAVADLAELKAAFDALFLTQAAAIPEARVLRDRVNRAIAARALYSACRAYDHGRPVLEAEELEAFAVSVCADVASVREYAGLRWRKRLGVGGRRVLRPLLGLPRMRRLRVVLGRRLRALRGL